MLPESTGAYWVAKLAGAIGGSVISLAYLLPRNRRDAFQRLCVGLVCGVLFGPLVSAKLTAWGFAAGELEQLMGSCAFTSAISWGAAGMIYRWMSKANVPGKEDK